MNLKKICTATAVLAAMAYGQNPPSHGAAAGQIVVQTAASAKPDAVSRAFQTHGAALKRAIPALHSFVLQVPPAALPAITKSLARTGLFTFVEPDSVAHGAAVPNDPSFGLQWHLSQVNAPAAWDFNTGSSRVTIAVIDSGADPNHPDLASRLVPGWSFLTASSDTHDVLGHGTATAGTAGAASNNATGVSGITWGNPIMPLVVLDSNDYATYSDIASAIAYAVDHGVRVINVSIGGSAASSTLQSAVNYAWNKGALVFASAMNAGTSAPYYPAACDNAIAVSATDVGDAFAGFSNYGSWIDFSAPGVNIVTTSNYGSYGNWSGTSFSSPLTAGIAALILSVNPGLSNSWVYNLLKQSAVDRGAPGFDNYYGWGRVDALGAVNAALGTASIDSTPPTVTISSPANGATLAGSAQISGTASDNVSLSHVDISIDGQLAGSSQGSPFSIAWNTAGAVNGSHTITVSAYDTSGNMSSATTACTVNNVVKSDTQAPAVAILNPLPNTLIGSPKPIAVSVSASDNVAVSQVSIYIDGVQVYTGTTAPFTYSWNTKKSSSGKHVITATAWDAAGNSASASPVTVIR